MSVEDVVVMQGRCQRESDCQCVYKHNISIWKKIGYEMYIIIKF